jgi:hypothetical protein
MVRIPVYFERPVEVTETPSTRIPKQQAITCVLGAVAAGLPGAWTPWNRDDSAGNRAYFIDAIYVQVNPSVVVGNRSMTIRRGLSVAGRYLHLHA